MYQYEVHLKSTPGFYAQYSGSVKVFADSPEDAIEMAFIKLKNGAFPDRSRAMWIVEEVVKLK